MKHLLFDPDIVMPRPSDLSNLLFWQGLLDWVEASPHAKFGKTSFELFVSSYLNWIQQSKLSENVLLPLLVRISAHVLDAPDEPKRSRSDSLHITRCYSIADRKDLFISDLLTSPSSDVDFATREANWSSCRNGAACDDCAACDVGLVLAPGAKRKYLFTRLVKTRSSTFPIKTCHACFKDAHGNHYAEDANTGLWWTKDFEGHAGTAYKTYRKQQNSLKFEADRDEMGNKIPGKHKGPRGVSISLTSLDRCANPHRHAR